MVDDVLEPATVRLDDPRRGEVVVAAGHQDAADAEPAALLEPELQDQPTVALPPPARPDAITDVASFLPQMGVQLVPEVELADERLVLDQQKTENGTFDTTSPVGSVTVPA
jgi:hypothetical protein